MQLFFEPNVKTQNFLSLEDSKHCIKVLRKKKGEIIQIIDGKGGFYTCRILDENLNKCVFKIEKFEENLNEKKSKINLYIAPTKNIDRIEFMLEKIVEIGISSINFIETEHSINKNVKINRLEKIAVSAIKQSLRTFLPYVNPEIQKFDQKLISKLKGKNLFGHLSDSAISIQDFKSSEDINIFIGPEGDFSSKEVKLAIDNNFIQVSLGKSRLRTETAGLYAVVILNSNQ